MDAQRTLRRAVSCAGIGLHSGRKVTLSLKPAPADSGIRFRRADLGGVEVPATVEHVCGIDNVVVELNSPEVPIMDGSAAPFIYLIQEAGVKELSHPRRFLKVVRPVA